MSFGHLRDHLVEVFIIEEWWEVFVHDGAYDSVESHDFWYIRTFDRVFEEGKYIFNPSVYTLHHPPEHCHLKSKEQKDAVVKRLEFFLGLFKNGIRMEDVNLDTLILRYDSRISRFFL